MHTLDTHAPSPEHLPGRLARLGLGLGFTVFGLNGFFGFLPAPPMPADAGVFLGALAATGYMFPLVKGTEVVAGALLLAGRQVPLALLLLAPVLVNVVLFHAVLAPSGLALPLALAGAAAYVAWTRRSAFGSIFAGGVGEARSARRAQVEGSALGALR